MARLQAVEFRKCFRLDFATVARGHHIYKKVWKPVVGETLLCHHDEREEAKLYNDYAIGIYLHGDQGCHEQLVCHLPIELSFLLCKFLDRQGCNLRFSPTGARMLEDGLVVPGTYTALSDSRGLLETLKTELDKKMLTLKHMKLEVGNISTKYIMSYH